MSVNLGFCEDISEGQKWRLDRCFFPSKVGGSPVWLNPSAMSASQCDSCKSNLKFLLQTYAQGDTEDSFHRSIFVFVCSSKNYCNAPPVIIRQQLPRDNKFYPSTAPNYEDQNEVAKNNIDYPSPHKMCVICGFKGPNRCAKCKSRFFCSKEHQVLDWKSGHKEACGTTGHYYDHPFLFTEYELVCEEIEIEEEIEEKETEKEIIEEQIIQLDEIKQAWKDVEEKEVEDQNTIIKELDDEHFQKWREILDEEPTQVLRYNRDNNYCLPGQPENFDFGKCASCGGERNFEFQLTPHLFTYFECSMSDWATVLVATCEKDCDLKETGCAREFSKVICYSTL